MTKFLAAYVGPSMNPTLRDPEIIEVRPYGGRPVRVGDVAFFLSVESALPMVHRVVRVTPTGISTLGDNNSREDAVLLQPGDVQGRVVGAWRGQKRRSISGGLLGRLANRWCRWRRARGHGASRVLRAPYHALARGGVIARFLPAPFRPRVVVFRHKDHDQFRLMLGRRLIGRYDAPTRHWQIQAPFRVLVAARALPREFELCLVDGRRWAIAPGDKETASIVSHMGHAMQLRMMSPPASHPQVTGGTRTTGPGEPPRHGDVRRLVVWSDAPRSSRSPATCFAPRHVEEDGSIECVLPSCGGSDGLFVQLLGLSSILARDAHTRGGVLLHGALAEKDGVGVILAAPSGTGKTTASGRLPPSWRSLCDDTTLVVRDPQGTCWAHPWPTWSRFRWGEPGGAWDVQHAVPLKGIFLLSRAIDDRVTPVGPGQAVSLLVECAEQASQLMAWGLSTDDARVLRTERFNNLCTLARAVPTHVLHISLSGAFWQEIERTLERRVVKADD